MVSLIPCPTGAGFFYLRQDTLIQCCVAMPRFQRRYSGKQRSPDYPWRNASNTPQPLVPLCSTREPPTAAARTVQRFAGALHRHAAEHSASAACHTRERAPIRVGMKDFHHACPCSRSAAQTTRPRRPFPRFPQPTNPVEEVPPPRLVRTSQPCRAMRRLDLPANRAASDRAPRSFENAVLQGTSVRRDSEWRVRNTASRAPNARRRASRTSA